jgi:putative ABC transport system substrate-binding protein
VLSAGGTPFDPDNPYVTAFKEALRRLGWVEGQNLVVEFLQVGDGSVARVEELARNFDHLKIEVAVGPSNSSIIAARSATTTIPIVMVNVNDPVGSGFAKSLASPGGNITGLSFSVGPEVTGKRLELLAEARRFSRFAVLVDSSFWRERMSVYSFLETTARARGIAMKMVEVREAGALATTFATLVKDHTEALLIGGGPTNFDLRGQIAELALRHRLPTGYSWREGPEAGGLLSYGPDLSARWSHAAVYVDKILKGAKPADLPLEQPTKFELVINLKTAKALGLTIPQSVLIRADQVIQ